MLLTKFSIEQKYHRSSFMRERYGISDPTLYRYTKSGKIPKPKFINGQRIWTDEDVELADSNLISH